MHRVMKAIGMKKRLKILRKDDQVRELWFLVKHKILPKYLINKITCKDMDMQIQGIRPLNECVR